MGTLWCINRNALNKNKNSKNTLTPETKLLQAMQHWWRIHHDHEWWFKTFRKQCAKIWLGTKEQSSTYSRLMLQANSLKKRNCENHIAMNIMNNEKKNQNSWGMMCRKRMSMWITCETNTKWCMMNESTNSHFHKRHRCLSMRRSMVDENVQSFSQQCD